MAEDIMLTAGVDTTPGERRLAELASRASRTRLNLTANVDDSSVVAFGKPLGRITGQADEFTKSMEAANARVLAFGASVGVINGITSAFKNLISSTIEVENSLTQIKIVGDETFSSIKEVSSGIFNVARQTGLSFKEASEATLEFSRQGKSLTESLEAAKAALILTRTTGLDATEAVKGLTSAVNVFSESGLTMERIVNKLAAVDTKFAVSSRDLIEGISRSASVAQEAGVSFDELTAFITTLQEKTGRGGAVIGNAMKTIFTRVQNPEILNDIKALGIAVEDTAGNFLPATQIVKNLAKEFDFLDKNVQKSILLKVGGGFQVDKTAALINDVAKANGTFQRSLSESANAQNQAYAKTAELNQTLSASFQNLLTSSKELGSNVGSITFSKDFTNIINSLGAGLQSLNDTIFGKDDGFKKSGDTLGQTVGRSILSGIGSVISGPALGIFLAIIAKLGYDFVKFSVQGLQTLLKITSQTKEEESIQKSIGELLYNNLDLQQKIFRLGDNRVAQAKELLKVYKEQGEQTKLMEQTKKEVASALYDSGLRGVSSGQPRIVAKASSGFLPSLSQAIISEKKQAPSSSKIIIDHNFPFGGGTRGTMVYNSNETRVPNFGGTGGDAIIPNYPISAAKGYVPNFAKEKDINSSQQAQKPDLLIDASAASVAGITAGGERGMIDKAKGKTITSDLLKKYEGSPFTSYLSNFGKINLVNVPVGNVYRTREGIKENEDSIKKNFTTRINTSLRPSILDFIQTELNRLQLNPGAGLRGNLNNLKFDIINSSSAGYILEEILKAPTLTDAEKLGQYKSLSESSFFDMYNLNPEFAESFGLPKRTYDYVDVKLGFKELKDTITSKYLNQAILEGGGASKLIKSAASGYIPDFAESIGSLKSRMKGSSQKGSGYLQNYYDVENLGFNDSYDANVPIVRFSFKKSLERYTRDAENVIADYKDAYAKDKKSGSTEEVFVKKWKNKYDKYLTSSFKGKKGYENLLLDPDNNPSSPYSGILRNIKGALGEKTFDEKFKDWTREPNENAGIDFYKGDEMMEIKVRGAQFTQEEANAKALAFLGSKSPKKGNEVNDIINLSDKKLYLYETFKNANKDLYQDPNKYLNAAEGYIPNFANINADILTANPMISQMSVDEFVNKYLGQSYSTGLSGTSANVKKLRDPSLAAQAKRDFLMSMLGVNFLATFNRDKDANLARKSLMDAKTKTGSRSEYVPGGFMQRAGNYVKPDLTNVIEGTFSGNAKELKYEELDSQAEKIFSEAGLSGIWNNDIINTLMQVADKHSQSEMIGANFDYRSAEEYKKVKAATAILRPALIQGLLGGEKGVQALMLNTPEADKSVVGKNSKYLALLDPNAANLQKYVSNFLINPDREPLDPQSPDAKQNLTNASDIVRTLDTYSPSKYSRKPIRLDALKAAREKARSNAQLRTFFGETAGAFQPIRKGADGSLGTTFKSSFPQEIIDRMAEVLTSTVNRGGIFQLSNLDFGYAGTPQESFEFNPKSPEIDTFKNSPSVEQIPQTLKYEKYLEKKDYYKSVAKWKYDPASKSMIRQAARGYIPNFSELTGTGFGMLYQDSNFSELGGGGSGKFLAPKSGQGFGQKIFYKQGSDKITQEYSVNKSIKDFEKENPALFAKNAIAFTNIGKILTRNGLAAGFEREVIGGSGVDEFATGTFPGKKGSVSAKAEFAFFLSELLAQAGVKNVVGEYRKKYGDNSLGIDDVYAQNFKLNDLMQSSVIAETNQFFGKRKNVSSDEVSKYINSLRGNPVLDSLNEKFGSSGARHTMFDTQGFSKNAQTAAKGYIPNFAYDLGTNKDNIAIRSVTSPFDEKGNRIRGTGAVKEAIIAAIAKAKSKGFNKITADAISDASVNAFIKQFGRAVKGKNTWGISEFKNAAGGYIPNFAGGGSRTTTLDTLKTIFKTVAPKLIETTIEGLLGIQIPDGTLTLETYEKIKAALEYSSAFVDKNSITGPVFQDFYQKQQLKKGLFSLDGGKTWKKQVSNASGGYIPNFASGIQDAINREKSATGLPDSMIKVSRDSRATNPSLNPSGIIVTNKIDEPRGAFDVPDYRMKTAYKNAAKSFYPNFAKDSVSGGAQPVGDKALNSLAVAMGISGRVQENLNKAIVENTNQIKASVEADKVKVRTNQNPYNNPNPNFLTPNSKVGVRTDFLQAGPSPTLIEGVFKEINERFKAKSDLSGIASGKFTYSGSPPTDPSVPIQIPSLPNRQRSRVILPQDVISTARLTEKDTIKPEAKTEKEIQKADFGDFAKKFVVLQSSISFLTGALSSLGDEGQKAAQVLGSLGQLGYLVSQGNDVFKLLNKGRGVGDVIASGREGLAAGGIGGLIGNAAKTAVGGGSAVAATGLGGGAAATLALGTAAVATGAAVYGLYKVFDGLGDVLDKTAAQGRKMGEVYDNLASKYSVKLTDAQQSRLSDIIEASDVKGTSFAGSLNRSGIGISAAYRKTKEFAGIDDETWRTNLEKSVSKMGETGENSQKFVKLFAPILSSKVEEKVGIKTEQGTIFDRKQFTDELVNQFDQLISGMAPAIDKRVAEIAAGYDTQDYKADLMKKLNAGEKLSSREKKDLSDLNSGYSLGPQQSIFNNARIRAKSEVAGEKLKELTPNALETAAAVAEPEQAKLKSIELFKREIELKIQSLKLEASLSTDLERRLSIQKELVTTTASERSSQEMLLKKIQDEKQLQLQLKELYGVKVKEKAEEYLGKIGVGVEEGTQKEILSALNTIKNDKSGDIKTLEGAYDEILKAADFAQRANDKAIAEYTDKLKNQNIKPDEKKDIENKLQERQKGSATTSKLKEALEIEKNAIREQFEINRKNTTELSYQKEILNRINYATSFRKDVLTAQIALEQKSFDIKQKTLDIQNKINDSQFKRSNINFANPNEEASISQSREERRNIGTSFEREMQQIQADIQKENLSNKQNVFNTAVQKGATPKQLEDITNSENYQQAYNILDEVLTNNTNGFEKAVTNAGAYFYEASTKGAKLIVDALSGVLIGNQVPDEFLQELKERFPAPEPLDNSIYRAKDLLPPETSSKDTENERVELANADKALKIKQYSYTQEKKFFDFRAQALSYSLQTAQKQLELEKQRIDTAQKLKDLQFEGQAMQEFNPVRAQKLRNAYQIDQGISQAQSSDLLANKSYLNDAKSKAFSEAQSRGGTLEDLKSIIEATNVKDIEDRLTKIIEDQITKTGSTDVGDIQVNAAKEAAKITVDAAKQAASISTGQPFNPSETYTPSVDAKKLIDNPKEAANLITKGKLGNAPVTQLDQAKQIADAQRANEAIRQNNESSFSTGMNQSLGEMQGRVDTFQNSIGREIPNAFRDGMVSAMKAASDVNNTKPLKDRLLDVANAFIDRINTKLMESIADNLTGGLANTGSGLMSAASSGIKSVFGFASGGQVSGGSGSKDDVPAMLTGGEFVVTKNAVNKYGPEFLTALNSGKIKKFATGGFVERDLSKYTDAKNLVNINSPIRGNLAFGANGQVENLLGVDRESLEKNNPGLYEYNMKKAQTEYYGKNAQSGEGGYFMPGQNGQGAIMGQRNLLAFATQNTTSTKFDKTVSGSDFAGIDIGAGSANLSLSALRDSNNLKNKQYLDSKQQATDLYFSGIDATKQKTDLEEQNRKQQEEYREQQKKARKQFWINAGIAAGGALIGSGLSAMAAGAANRIQSYSTAGGQEMSSWDKLGYGLKGTMVGAEGSGGLAGYFRGAGNATQRLDTFQRGSNGQMYAWNNSNNQYVAAKYNPYSSFVNPNTNPFAYRKAAGGQVAGAGNGDNVPTMLNGGEFIMSKQATQRMGPQKLQQINSGGESGDSEGVATRIEAKLEELIEKIAGVGTINITVNGDSKNSKEDTTSSSGSSENNKELARKIKEMVLYTIKEEKRLGGMLR